MDERRFDTISKSLTATATRRRALFGAAGGGLAAALGAVALRPGAAQDDPADATPGATPSLPGDEGQEFLFVQVFTDGTWTPNPDQEGVYILSLTGHAAQTIYFSDRPERVVGTVPTTRFLDGLGFTPANPPNAALVTPTADGQDVLVVELFNPVYTQVVGAIGDVSITYQARILDGYSGTGLAPLAAQQIDADLPAVLGPSSLFIDDCPDGFFLCTTPNKWLICDPGGSVTVGQCWSWLTMCDWGNCGNPTDPKDLCNQQYPAFCNGECITKTNEQYQRECIGGPG